VGFAVRKIRLDGPVGPGQFECTARLPANCADNRDICIENPSIRLILIFENQKATENEQYNEKNERKSAWNRNQTS